MRVDEERGMSMSPMVALLVPALLVMVGLVIDGGAQAAGSRRAERVAAAGARVGSDAAAAYRISGQPGAEMAAVAAANTMLASESELSGTARINGTAVEVHTTVRTRTVLLSLIGVTTLTSNGYAKADLMADR